MTCAPIGIKVGSEFPIATEHRVKSCLRAYSRRRGDGRHSRRGLTPGEATDHPTQAINDEPLGLVLLRLRTTSLLPGFGHFGQRLLVAT
jgi:hypothetical protein